MDSGEGSDVLNAVGTTVTDFVQSIFGPALDEFGQMAGDKVRLYRYGQSLRAIAKAEKMAKDAGFTPKAVPIKLLFPILDGASFEEDEDLHDMWSALLANAACTEAGNAVRPAFIAALKQMAPDEAKLLNWLFDNRERAPLSGDGMVELYKRLYGVEGVHPSAIDPVTVMTCIYNLQAMLFVTSNHGQGWKIDLRAVPFVYACRPPSPKPNA